jgi:IS30 family transposase
LTARERERIAIGRAEKQSVRRIAREMGRPASTVSREIARNSGADGRYRVLDAERSAQERAKRPKRAKLVADTPLRRYVVAGLREDQSPEQIANRIRLEHPCDPEMRVCHETIYQAIYVESRGGLKHEMDQSLRQGRVYRQPRRATGERRGRIPGMVPIAERPDIADRLVPGHWEGDLMIGKNNASAVATLVERRVRYPMLGHLDSDHTAPAVRDAIVPLLAALPDQVRRSLTWDQGREMACHFEVADQANIEVYFADPHSPWQRGTNENTNGLLRQYLPKGTDLSVFSSDDLQAIADRLNNRPRKVLGWLTPTEALHLTLGHTVIIGGQPAELPDNLKPLAQRCVDQ